MSSSTARSSLTEGLEAQTAGAPAGGAVGAVPFWKSNQFKIGLSTVLIVLSLLLVLRSVGGTTMGDLSRSRVVVDSVTGEVFPEFRIKEGSTFPWKNPKTGENTLYPAEPCFWTADGKAKLEPTYVFVKAYAGAKSKTVCPDCGREVRQHNPNPPDSLMLDALKARQGK
jgi:hypothetical protein